MSESVHLPDPAASESSAGGTGTSFGATQSLYRKYRPQSFDSSDLVGHDPIVRTLRNAIRLDRVAHAYLFTGPHGTGKTTTARLLAKAVNCLDPNVDARPCNACAACVAINTSATTDIIEIDAASNRGIDDIRELRERVKFAPTFLKTKFYIVDEAHQITGAAANAFLKTLEEPPPHTKFILATTDPEQLLPTIVSRCQRFDFKRISRDHVVERLATVAASEGIPIETEALQVIGEHAGGSLRDALGLLDQLTSYRDRQPDAGARQIDANDVRALLGVARGERVLQLAEALAEADAGAGLALINAAFEAGEDPRQINRQLVALLRAVLFQAAAGSPGPDQDVNALASRFSLAEIARHAARFSEIDYRIRHATLPQLPLEIAFVQASLDRDDHRELSAGPTLIRTSPSDAPTASTPADRAPRSASPPRAVQETPSPQSPVEENWRPAPATSAVDVAEPSIGGGPITVDLLHDLWPKIRLDIKARDRRIEALLSSCDPATVNGNAITLVTSYKFHWEKMNEDASRRLVESVIGRLVNQTVSVNTEIRSSNGSSNGMAIPKQDPAAAAGGPATARAMVRTADEQTLIDAARNIFDADELTPRS